MSLILIRYGELALKSHKVRRRFEEHLIEEISRRFDRLGLDWMIEREQGRIFLHTSEKSLTKAIFVLRHVPGIFSVSPVMDFEIDQVAVNLQVTGTTLGPDLGHDFVDLCRGPLRVFQDLRRAGDFRKMRHWASMSFAWWCTEAIADSATPGPPETISNGTCSA